MAEDRIICDPTEDHERYANGVIPDPWSDPEQTDWPMNPEGGSNGSSKLGRSAKPE